MAKARKKASRTPVRRKSARAAKKSSRAAKKPAKVSWLAKGYPVMSPATVVDECARAIDWYKNVLGAKQKLRLDMPGGMVAHCELAFGDAVLMLGSPMPPQYPAKRASLALYVRNCDATYQRALAEGAHSLQEPADQFYGDRNARFEDPFGNEWTVMTHIRDVSPSEMKKMMAEMAGGG